MPRSLLAETESARIYAASEPESEHLVALKTLREASRERDALRSEVRTLMSLTHEGVVSVEADGSEDETPWVALELVLGEDLAQRWRREREANLQPTAKELEASLSLLLEVCHTLAFLHGEGVVHRDLKPANIVVREDGRPVLVDFGLAARLDAARGREALERGGVLQGTPAYMAPEQIWGDYVDARADLYALGCLLYEAATGRPPFEGLPADVIARQLNEEPAAPSKVRPDVPARLDALIVRLLAKAPRERPGYAADVATALAGILGREIRPVPHRAYLYRPGLTGREEILSRLDGALGDALDGTGGVVCLAGESGTGKTRLAMELTRRAHARGFTVATGECVTVEGAVGRGSARATPLLALRPAMRLAAEVLSRGDPQSLRGSVGESIGVLATLEPSLARLQTSDARSVVDLPTQAQRDRLLDSLRVLLDAAAAVAPLVVVLDDMQWADELTLAMVERLTLSPMKLPLVVVATYRSEEVSQELRRITDLPGVTVHPLEHLEADAVDRMVSDMLATDTPPSSLVASLAAHSEGNPFFVSEYLRAAVESKLFARDADGRWALPDGVGSEVASLPLPSNLEELIARRFEALEGSAARLLESAAVLGRLTELDLAGEVAGLDRRERLTAMRELFARRILEPRGARGVRFSHDKLREAAYQGLDAEQAVRLHAGSARAIEQAYGATEELAGYYVDLGHHHAASDSPQQASHYFALGGADALKEGAHRDAAELLSRSLDLDQGRGTAHERGLRLRLLGDARFGTADFEGCVASQERALAALGAPLARSALGRLAGIGVEGLRQIVYRLGPGVSPASEGEAQQRFREAALSAGRYSETSYLLGMFTACMYALLKGMNLADRSGDRACRAIASSNLGYLIGTARMTGIAESYFQRVRELGVDTLDPSEWAGALWLECVHHLGQGNWERSRQVGAETLKALAHVADSQDREGALTVLAHGFFYRGRVEHARRCAELVTRSGAARANPQREAWGNFTEGRSLVAQGRAEEAVAKLEHAHALILPLEDTFSRVMCQGPLAQACFDAGAHERAWQIVERLDATLVDGPLLSYAPCLDGYEGLAEVTTAAFWRDPSPTHLNAARRASGRLHLFASVFRVAAPAAWRYRARLEALRGRPRRAHFAWARSAAWAETLDMPLEAGLTHADWGRLADDAADRADHASQAEQLAGDTGSVLPARGP